VVGVLLYELLPAWCRRPALWRRMPLPRGVPGAVSKAIMKTLASERTARFNSWEEFRKAITGPHRALAPKLGVFCDANLAVSGDCRMTLADSCAPLTSRSVENDERRAPGDAALSSSMSTRSPGGTFAQPVGPGLSRCSSFSCGP